MPKSAIASLSSNCMLRFLSNLPNYFPGGTCHFSLLPAMHGRSSFSASLSALRVVAIFHFSPADAYRAIVHSDFNSHLLGD